MMDFGYCPIISKRASTKEIVGRGSGGKSWPEIGVNNMLAFLAEYLRDNSSWLS